MPASQLRATVRDTLGPVLSHDATRGTDYLDTVRTYLRHDKHLGGTASELHLHYNTVRNRVARIEGLLELSFDRPDDRFRAETAVRMLAVLDAVGDDSTEVPPSE
ncbi:PucR family transcriptional regulator [Brevibacterium linens]